MIYKIAEIEYGEKLQRYFFIEAESKKQAIETARSLGDCNDEEAGFKEYVFIKKRKSMKKFGYKHIAAINSARVI